MKPASIESRILSAIWIGTLVLVLVTPGATGLAGLIIVTLVLPFSGIYLGFRYGARIFVDHGFSRMLLAAGALITVSFLVTARQPSDLQFLGNFFAILAGPPLLFLSRRFSGTEWAQRVVLMAAAGAILNFLIAAYEILVLGYTRAAGFYLGGANEFGQFTLLYGAICLGGLMLCRETMMRAILVLASGASAVVIFWSGSRGVAIAALPTALFAAGFALAGQSAIKRIVAVSFVGLFFAVGILSAANLSAESSTRIFGTLDQIQETVTTGRSSDPSLQTRLHLYRSGWNSFISSPVFGAGWVKSLEDANALVRTDTQLPETVTTAYYPLLHSDPVGFGASMGLFGLVAFALLIAAPWSGLGQMDDLHRFRLYLLIAMVPIFHIFALNDVSLTVGAGLAVYVVMGALICGTFRTAAPETADP